MLSAFEHRLDILDRRGPADAEVRAAAEDSRQVRPGTLFAAIPGIRIDGHRFIPGAVASGASVVVLRDWPADGLPPGCVGLQVADPRRALAVAASALVADPTASMIAIGITGTNGKTTTACILACILRAAGHKTGTLGTTGIEWDGDHGLVRHAATHTTPGGPALFSWLGRMRDDGVDAVALELSSHALDQGRAAGLALDVAAWSNLSLDHLDYHHTMEAYEAAKARIFTEQLARWGKDGCQAVVNVDDPVAARHAGDWPRTLRVSTTLGVEAEVVPTAPPVFTIDGCHAPFRTPGGPLAVRTRLVGPHNLENAALAAGCALAAGIDLAAIEAGLSSAPGAPGRLERVELPGVGGPRVLVDYAHTPDALVSVLAGLRSLVSGRLTVVFGCGGDRDPTKRGPMGEAAGRGADFVVVTSDNPRSEDPEAILDAIEPGLAATGTPYLRCADRGDAIEAAIHRARSSDDVVLIAGKGHETTQDLGDRTIPFDDREHARAVLDALRGGS
jgi:UDP-N-acetylmuramoyl-L-alanyl-D-glutamate--2,6-diaminopimelate ligase